MTDAAKEFITPITMQALVATQSILIYWIQRQKQQWATLHLAKWADAIIVSPCSANTLAKISQGLGDDLLTAVILASEAKKYFWHLL